MYNVKARIQYTNSKLINLAVFKTKNTTADGARTYIEAVISDWQGIDEFKFLEISTRQMKINKYFFEITIKTNYHLTKKIKLNVKAEHEEEATLLLDDILQGWRSWSEYQINKIQKI